MCFSAAQFWFPHDLCSGKADDVEAFLGRCNCNSWGELWVELNLRMFINVSAHQCTCTLACCKGKYFYCTPILAAPVLQFDTPLLYIIILILGEVARKMFSCKVKQKSMAYLQCGNIVMREGEKMAPSPKKFVGTLPLPQNICPWIGPF